MTEKEIKKAAKIVGTAILKELNSGEWSVRKALYYYVLNNGRLEVTVSHYDTALYIDSINGKSAEYLGFFLQRRIVRRVREIIQAYYQLEALQEQAKTIDGLKKLLNV
jgi:hypothetical protein